MENNFTIYYDSLTEASWFQDLNPLFEDAKFEIIKNRGQNPTIIENIIQYDKPDIILLHNNTPVLVLEITQEVPTGHNVGQRFARLVRGIELGIPTIYYYPFDARKYGDYSNICNLNIRLLHASFNIMTIHDTPLLSVNWITDSNGDIITDGTENITIHNLINCYIHSNFNKYCDEFTSHINWMKDEYSRRLKIRPSYAKMPNSVIKMSTSDFCTKFNIKNCSSKFKNRNFTYLYKIGMKPSSCKRQDPYTGTQFIYDYMVCRNGKKVSDKINNLVLYFPNLTSDIWFDKNPNNPNTKSCNWYLTANALLFKNDIYFNID
ncbi:hypothetical protein AAGC94_22585 [Clostridium sporogenes]|uniref:hypothetical protein n=1 Tax=Clostridium sporogenes TaxID=1509 RepID=UPI00313D2076